MASKKLTAAFVQALNKNFAGSSVLVNKNGPGSALAGLISKAAHEPSSTVTDRAASLAYGLIMNHPFMDGNKRTAHEAAEEYLKEHGAGSLKKDAKNVSDAHSKVAKGQMDDKGLAAIYKAKK